MPKRNSNPGRDEKIDGYERRRLKTRQNILLATSVLIRENEDTEFSVREIADSAGVSPATPFNHFSSKRGIFSAIIEDSLEFASFDSTDSHPAGRKGISEIFIRISKIYIEDSKLYRPLFKAVLPNVAMENSSFQFAVDNIAKTIQQAVAVGEIKSGANVRLLAEQLETFWLGTLVIWTSGSIDGPAWISRLEHGIALMLQSLVAPGQ